MKQGKKGKNTFKFQSFAERISNINIDVQNIGKKSQSIPENERDTFFREKLEQWAELNCSLDFTDFYRQVKPLVASFHQLLYHKENVTNILKFFLQKEESLAIEPCLDLLGLLSKDLLKEFLPYLEDVFQILFSFLKKKDAQLIENTFVCFGHIFKNMWSYMVNDLASIFQ